MLFTMALAVPTAVFMAPRRSPSSKLVVVEKPHAPPMRALRAAPMFTWLEV